MVNRGSVSGGGPGWLPSVLFALVLLCCLWSCTGVALAGEGAYDPSFGHGDGIAAFRLGFGTYEPGATALSEAVQPDGKVVVAGFSDDGAGDSDFLIARLTTAGALDPSFGAGGVVRLDVDPQFHSGVASAVAVQKDGKIVTAGWRDSGWEPPVVVRLLPNGKLDQTFGSGGVYSLKRSGYDVTGTVGGMAIAPDGDIFIAGTGSTTDGRRCAMVAKLTASGSGLDANFGDGGLVCDEFGVQGSGAATYVAGIVLNVHGTLDLVGLGYPKPSCCSGGFVAQLDQDTGGMDTGFGDAGVAWLPHPAGEPADGQAIAVQPDGDVVAVGSVTIPPHSANELEVDRLLQSGRPDPAFGSGGVVLAFPSSLPDSAPRADSVAVRPDGEILASAAMTPAGQSPTDVGLLTSAGRPDRAFAGGYERVAGDLTTVIGLPDNRALLTGGISPVKGGYQLDVTRLLGP